METGRPKDYLGIPLDEVYYRLGDCYENLNDTTAAAGYFELFVTREGLSSFKARRISKDRSKSAWGLATS